MACEDRQLTEAQRVAGYQNQRTGVQQALRPFSGRPTLDNLIDYINRELQPAVRAVRNKVNDIYLPVIDNAPSGNPLGFYFSTETGNADPTAGRIRLNQATQDTATVIRVSESNGRLASVAPWLDVMAGGATTPLGVVTLSDANNPGRFIRFDLTSMTDQGAYWDLAVSPVESSHDNPFVDGGPVVLAFIPGVGGGTPATVPPTSISGADGPRQFLSTSTGTTPDFRTLSAIFPGAPIYDVMAYPFSAASNGSTDDLAAINAAIAAANAAPGIIYLGSNHRITAGLDPITASCVVLMGRGMDGGGTTLTCTTTPTSIITIGSGARFSGVCALRVGSSAASQSGYAIRLTEAFRCFAIDIRTLTTGSGVEVDRCNTTYLENIDVTDPLGAYGIHIHGDSPDFNHVTRLVRCQVGRAYPLTINDGRGDWAAGTAYALGDIVRSNGGLWQCSTAGTSGATAPGSSGLPSSSASTVHTVTVTDGTCQWRYGMGAFEGYAHGSFAHTVFYQECGALQGYRGWYIFDDQGDTPTFVHGWQCSADHPLFTGIHLEACDGAVMFDQTLTTSVLTSGQPGITIGASATRWQFNGGEANQGVTIAGTAGVLRGVHTSTIALESTADEVLVEHNHLTGNLTIASGADNYVVSGNHVGGTITNTPGRSDTRVVEGNIPDTEIAVGSVWGLQIDHGASDVPREVTKFELGENLRRETVVVDSTSSGTSNTYTISSTTTQVQFKLAGALTINGMTAATLTFGKLVAFSFDSGHAGSVTWNNESLSAGSSLERVRTPGAQPLTISAGEVAVFEYFDSRWRCIAVGKANNITDGDKGDITVSASGATWTIDNDVVTDGKLRNSGACSVIGRSANSSGDPADISAAANDRLLARTSDSVAFQQLSNGMVPTNTIGHDKLVNVAVGTVLGRQVDAGSTGAVVALTGPEIGENLRLDTLVTDSSTSGTASPYSVATQVNWVRFNGLTGTYTLNGCDNVESGKIIAWHVEPGVSGSLVLVHNNGAITNNQRFFCPGGVDLTLRAGETAITVQTTNRQRVLATSRVNAIADGDKGDITVASSGTSWTIDNDVVTDAKLRNSAALSVIGRSANSTGDPADIAAANDAEVLRRSGTTLGFGQVATAGIADNAVTSAKMRQGGPLTVIGRSANSLGNVADIGATPGADEVLRESGNTLGFGTVATGGIANAAVTLAKMENRAQSTIIGRAAAAGTGAPQALTGAQVRTILSESPLASALDSFGTVVNASTTKTAVVSLTLGAGTLAAGMTFEMYTLCQFFRAAGGAATNLTLTGELNGTAEATLTRATDTGAVTCTFEARLYFTIDTTGASGTCRMTGTVAENIQAATNPMETYEIGSTGITIDTTASNTIRFAVQFSAAVAGTSVINRRSFIRRIL